MVERPATDPAKSGTNLAKQLALGRRGGIRYVEVPAADEAVKKDAEERPRSGSGKLKRAKAALVAAEKPKGGRPSKGEPWKALGLTRRTYYRRLKAGTL